VRKQGQIFRAGGMLATRNTRERVAKKTREVAGKLVCMEKQSSPREGVQPQLYRHREEKSSDT